MKESTKIPSIRAAIADLNGRFFREKGNNKITGQHGVIPFIFSQSGDAIIKAGKHIITMIRSNL